MPSSLVLPLLPTFTWYYNEVAFQGLLRANSFFEKDIETWLLGKPRLRRLDHKLGIVDVGETEWVVNLGLLEKNPRRQEKNCRFHFYY